MLRKTNPSTSIPTTARAGSAHINHDCEPNTDWALDADGCIVVRTLSDVPAGRELCLSYVDVRLPAATRKAKLRRSFFFTCACDACAAGVARWSCSLCLRNNGAFDDTCGGERCGARRSSCSMPVLPRGDHGRASGGPKRRRRVLV